MMLQNMPTITDFTRSVKKPAKTCRLNRSRPSLSKNIKALLSKILDTEMGESPYDVF
ncbi:hypothetical protein [Clostridium sp. KNHs205]|uniref:hypothetical protein n=1 Tax=Clostridium sp. KNHs205 TaxID=1449050 RepID=UPI0012DED440|nr:hypothetical protein [Clostridium sp. KNHs205]